jgi:branched-chain amino acid transport system permease protein
MTGSPPLALTVPRNRTRVANLLSDRRIFLPPLLLVAGIPAIANAYVMYVVNLALVYALVGLGFNVVIGTLGQVALISAALFGIGAYSAALLLHHLGLPFILALPAAGVAGAIGGGLVSLPVLRGLRGFYLAAFSIACTEVLRWVYIHWQSVTLGSMGMTVPATGLFGWQLNSEFRKFYLLLGILVLLIVANVRLLACKIGRAWVGIRESEQSAASLGIPTARYIAGGFVWSGFILGIAGALFSIEVGFVAPDNFDQTEIFMQFAIVAVGGLGSIGGAVIGAGIMALLPQVLGSLPGLQEAVTALCIILVLAFLPRGLVSLLAHAIPSLRNRYHGHDA